MCIVTKRSIIGLLCLLSAFAAAEVQINPPFAMPDVNIVEDKDQDKVYAFCGTDLEPYGTEPVFIMPYWRCFSSNDLIHWTFESYLHPKDTYIGATDKCFAGHGIQRDGKWYWYFSDFVKSTGVAVADSPKGPWKDPLGKPLLPEDLTQTHEYDNCVFIDNDSKIYMTFGAHINRKLGYHIVQLNEDMISLKEEPRFLEVTGVPEGKEYMGVDASFLHKHNGRYYLSWRRPYAVADNPYGPYKFMGLQDAHGHLGFFDFRNQNFVNYTTLKTDQNLRRRYRFASIAYVHYKDDGRIAPMEPLIAEHGVGQYQADWPAIQAEWYMAMPDGPEKREIKDGFEVRNLKSGDYLVYPNIHGCPYNPAVELTYSCENADDVEISIRAYAPNGPEIGHGKLESTGTWDQYAQSRIQLDKTPAGSLSLCFVFKSKSGQEIARLDSFQILE